VILSVTAMSPRLSRHFSNFTFEIALLLAVVAMLLLILLTTAFPG